MMHILLDFIENYMFIFVLQKRRYNIIETIINYKKLLKNVYCNIFIQSQKSIIKNQKNIYCALCQFSMKFNGKYNTPCLPHSKFLFISPSSAILGLKIHLYTHILLPQIVLFPIKFYEHASFYFKLNLKFNV